MSPALARKPLMAALSSGGTFCLALLVGLVLAVADAARPSPAQIPEVGVGARSQCLLCNRVSCYASSSER